MLRKLLSGLRPDTDPPALIDPCYGDSTLRNAAASAVAGNYQPAETILNSLKDWDDRRFAIGYFARCGQGEDWCDRWHDAFPDSRHAPVVHAYRLVELAWDARGGAWTPDAAGFQIFQTRLAEASRAFEEAADRWPEDPCPWAGRINVAIGQQQGLAVARGHFEQACRRAPHLIAAHENFLQASTAKWSGSDQAMMAHATAAATRAPQGHPLHALPLFALRERSILHSVSRDKAAAAAIWTSPDAARFCDSAMTAYIRSPSRKPRRDDARFAGITAFACARLDRHTDALAAFDVCGPWVSERVWGDSQPGVENFTKTRRECRARAG